MSPPLSWVDNKKYIFNCFFLSICNYYFLRFMKFYFLYSNMQKYKNNSAFLELLICASSKYQYTDIFLNLQPNIGSCIVGDSTRSTYYQQLLGLHTPEWRLRHCLYLSQNIHCFIFITKYEYKESIQGGPKIYRNGSLAYQTVMSHICNGLPFYQSFLYNCLES